MLSNLICCFGKKSYGKEAQELRERPKETNTARAITTKYVYRDELSKDEPSKKTSPIKAEKKRVRFANSEPEIITSTEEAKFIREVVRVRVKMTKEEASRILSKCRDGGVIDFNHVANQLLQLPLARPNDVPSTTAHRHFDRVVVCH